MLSMDNVEILHSNKYKAPIMSTLRWNLLMISYILLMSRGLGFDCPYKECYCVGVTISCVDRGMNTTPQLISNNTAGLTSLMFDVNEITDVPAGSLASNLYEISFDYNPITRIDDSAFLGSADTLEILTFWGARFSTIPDALIHLKSLRHFAVYDSNIVNWNIDVMKSIGLTLESLTLRNAGVLLSPSWIQYLTVVTELNLEGCVVTSLPDNAFDNVAQNLTSLSLYNNSLTEIPMAISNLSVLVKLNLGSNQISDISSLPRSQLRSLTLDNNHISDGNFLSTILRISADTLRTLTLQVNHLTDIPDLKFLVNIIKLDLTYNQISDPNSGSMPPGMFALDLGYNLLPRIPRAMSNLTRLLDLTMVANLVSEITAADFPLGVIWVHLGYNLITELNASMFPPNSSIQYLHLNNNPISYVAINTFENLARLTLVNLAATKITRLPLALTSVKTLIVFDATNCTELVCTCQEKELGQLFTSLLPGDIHGNCGDTSIYDFFATFTSGCPAV